MSRKEDVCKLLFLTGHFLNATGKTHMTDVFMFTVQCPAWSQDGLLVSGECFGNTKQRDERLTEGLRFVTKIERKKKESKQNISDNFNKHSLSIITQIPIHIYTFTHIYNYVHIRAHAGHSYIYTQKQTIVMRTCPH